MQVSVHNLGIYELGLDLITLLMSCCPAKTRDEWVSAYGGVGDCLWVSQGRQSVETFTVNSVQRRN